MSSELLDDGAKRRELDPGGMMASVHGLPQQCREAWQAAQSLRLPPDYRDIERIVVLGMGGSAIAGDFWRVLLQRECRVPVFNVRGYDLPPFVDGRALVIASSYSGGTEETLSAFSQALSTPAKKIAITSGGQLLATARANGVPTFAYHFAGEPRAAIGWSLMPLLHIGETLGLMQGVRGDVDEAIAVMERLRDEETGEDVPSARNPAKQLAERLHEKLPVVYGAGPLIEAAHRWKTQLNESAKVWAFFEELPEIHHNAIIGYGLPRVVTENSLVVFLQSADLVHRRVQLRFGFTQDLLRRAGVDYETVDARGESALAQMTSLVLFGDYVSVYLAYLYGVDPTPTTVIDELKDWLSRQE